MAPDKVPNAAFDAELFKAIVAGIPGSDLWPHQIDGIQRLQQAYGDGIRRVMLQMATGGGKTRLASTVAKGLIAIDKPVLFTVPALELVDQTLERFWAEGIDDIGIIQAYHPMTARDRPVQIASVQTLMRRKLPPADGIVFIDEAHRWFKFYGKWFLVPAWRNVPFIGLSATPWRNRLGAYFERLIIAATTQQLIDSGHLSDFKVFAPSHPDLRGVHTVAGDYDEGELGDAMNKPLLVADIVETWLQHGVGLPTLCFAVNRVHADHIRQRFEQAGVRAGYVDCFTPALERAEIRRKFASGELQVVCNVNVLTMGVDWDVRCIILARPTKSEMLYVQMLGRGLRRAEGKDYCLILDHSDSTLRLGFVTDIHYDELSDGKARETVKRDSIKLPKECPNCAYLRPASTPTCPNCGFTAVPINKIKNAEGELVELRRDKTQVVPVVDRHQWHRMLTSIQQARGYSPKWAKANYHEKFGTWPPVDIVEPLDPSREVVNWVTSRQIAFAKSRRRGARQTFMRTGS
jgi:superfamily II DNA or RNA helicase